MQHHPTANTILVLLVITAAASALRAEGGSSAQPAKAATAASGTSVNASPADWVIPKTFQPDTTKTWPGNASADETRKAADAGNPLAQCAMGDICAKTASSVPADAAQAVVWYQKASEQGYAVAQFRLALKYSRGTGVKMDEVTAASWFQKAADQGNKEAARHLGDMYFTGRGPVKQDYPHALLLYEKAVEISGDALSECFIADMYAQGLGIAQNKPKALELYQDAANANGGNAQCKLGDLYANGTDLPKDLARSYAWYTMATVSGDPNMVKQAKKGISALEPTLTPEQKADAEKLVQSFRETVKRNKRPFHY